MPKNKESNYKSAFLYLFKFIKPHRKWFLAAVAISLVLACVGLVNVRVTQLLVDSSINGNTSKITGSLILLFLVISVNITFSYISSICVSKLAANTSMDLKRHIGGILLHAKYSEIIKLKAGDTLSTINSDTGVICNFIAGSLVELLSQYTMALGALVYLLCINPFLALITFAYTPVGMFFTLSLNHKMNRLYQLMADYKGEALSVVEQALSQLPVIKSFMMEKQIRNRIHMQYDNVCKTEMKISVWNSLLQTACSSTSYIPRIIYMVFAGNMVMHGDLTTGAFIAVFDLLTFIIGPTVYSPFMLNGLNNSVAAINRIKRLEDIPQVQSTEKFAIPKTPAISIDHLSFGYSEERPVIQNFSLYHSGSGIIAVCGKSGSGKTTLLDIIAGLNHPDNGSLAVKGEVSVVSQDTYLFRTSLMENVRLAKQEAADEEVISALKLAGADEFARALPDSYYTLLGDGNTDLSGGQRQRISLARTILANSQIWLLDEPTSALDPQTESIVLDVILRMSKEKLIIISAHRKSLIDIADRVVYVEGA